MEKWEYAQLYYNNPRRVWHWVDGSGDSPVVIPDVPSGFFAYLNQLGAGGWQVQPIATASGINYFLSRQIS